MSTKSEDTETSWRLLKQFLQEKDTLNVIENKSTAVNFDKKENYKQILTNSLSTCDVSYRNFTKDSNSDSDLNVHNPVNSKESPREQKSDQVFNCRKGNKGRPFKCETCVRYFRSTDGLITHKQSGNCEEGPHKCPKCSKLYSTILYLDRHLRRVHTNVQERRFKCSICSCSFTELYALKRHSLMHRQEKPFKCSACSRSFTRRDLLTLHRKSHFVNKPFKCDICPFAFKSENLLSQHKSLHSSGFECDICHKLFEKKFNLRRHTIRMHTQKK